LLQRINLSMEFAMSTTSAMLDGPKHRKSSVPAISGGWGDNLARGLAVALLSGVVSAVLAAAAVGFSVAGGQQFGWEWAALWALGLLTVMICARAAFALANLLAPWLARAIESRRQRNEDRCFLSFARSDPRLMAEIDSAMRRSEWN
jgi:hypothetical protein